MVRLWSLSLTKKGRFWYLSYTSQLSLLTYITQLTDSHLAIISHEKSMMQAARIRVKKYDGRVTSTPLMVLLGCAGGKGSDGGRIYGHWGATYDAFTFANNGPDPYFSPVIFGTEPDSPLVFDKSNLAQFNDKMFG